MTDLFAYHVARQHLADLRRTAGQTRLTTATNHRLLANTHIAISRVLSRISTAVTIGQPEPNVASRSKAAEP